MASQHTKRFLFALLIACGVQQSPALGAGGTVQSITDGTFDGYYYALSGSGFDRFISEYLPGDFDPGSIICGARLFELNQGAPPLGTMFGDLRVEDGSNPGYPELGPGGLIANVDPASVGTCSTSPTIPRIFTFGGG